MTGAAEIFEIAKQVVGAFETQWPEVEAISADSNPIALHDVKPSNVVERPGKSPPKYCKPFGVVSDCADDFLGRSGDECCPIWFCVYDVLFLIGLLVARAMGHCSRARISRMIRIVSCGF